MTVWLDLNADLGEERGDDAALMALITSVNIACGGHAGTPGTMERTLRLARDHGVAAGAHPGYADRANFGRRILPLSPSAIEELITSQLRTLATIASREGVRLAHVKPHGALYNLAASDSSVATAIAQAIAHFDPALILVGLAQSQLTRAGEYAGLRVAHEAFADRAYQADGTLLPRASPGAVLHDPALVLAQVCSIATTGCVTAVDGTRVQLRADTVCIHGDTPAAVDLARQVRAALTAGQVQLTPLSERRT